MKRVILSEQVGCTYFGGDKMCNVCEHLGKNSCPYKVTSVGEKIKVKL